MVDVPGDGEKKKPADNPKPPGRVRQMYEKAKTKVVKTVRAAGEKISVALPNLDVVKSWFNSLSVRNLQTVNPVFAYILPRAKEIFVSKYKNADVEITSGGRTAAEQHSLFQKGRSKPGGVVTNADGYRDKSNHQNEGPGTPGQAVDYSIYVKGKYIANGEDPMYRKFYDCVQQAATEAGIKGLEWGGFWDKPFDPSHLQYKGPPVKLAEKTVKPAFKKACHICRDPKPKDTPGERIMKRIVPEGSVLDTYLKQTAPPSIFKF